MAEMDIYMRRRLVALGGLVAFFIIFVLVVKSCGGDDEPRSASRTMQPAGATGETGAALTTEHFIEEADNICGPANLPSAHIDPADPERGAGRVRDHPRGAQHRSSSCSSPRTRSPSRSSSTTWAPSSAPCAPRRRRRRRDVPPRTQHSLRSTPLRSKRAHGQGRRFCRLRTVPRRRRGAHRRRRRRRRTTQPPTPVAESLRRTPPSRHPRTTAPRRRPPTTAPPRRPRMTAAAESPPKRPAQPRRRTGARTRRPPRSARRASPARRSVRAPAPRSFRPA